MRTRTGEDEMGRPIYCSEQTRLIKYRREEFFKKFNHKKKIILVTF